jgi:hypothetical protein
MSSDARSRVDVPTIIAISALAYTLANIVHEGVGHGGTCVLVGARATVLNAIFFEYDEHGATLVQQKWISAGGTIANLLVGLPILPVLRRERLPASSRYFLWLFAAVNLLTAFGYLLFSGIAGIGDWANVAQGLGPPWLLRGAMAIAGAVLYFVVAPRLLMPPLDPFLGTDAGVRAARARMLCLIPYLAGGVSLVVAGILNPYGMRVVLISAVAAGFGGTSLLSWYPGVPRTPSARTPAEPLAIERSWAWIAAGAAVMTFFVVVLGPGLRLG